MKISREQVLHIAALAKLGITETDVDKFSVQLSNILEVFESLQQLNTSDIEPTIQAVASQNVIMCDEVRPSMSREDVLANAPQREEDFFKVKIVLED
jgi:aspartyl-tRNA(Asn)/glutamyl-tRNA(Gln) amidotransferase subunit C